MPFAVNSIVEYTVTGAAVILSTNAAAAGTKFANVDGDPAAPFFTEGSRLIGRIVSNAGGIYTVQFGPVVAAGGGVPVAAQGLQVLNIPEAHLLSRMAMTNVFVSQPLQPGGSRKRRQSKKRRNHKNHNNKQ